MVPIIDELKERGIAPEEVLADTGYGSGENIVQCAERGVELVAPVQDPHAPAPSDPWQEPVAAQVAGGGGSTEDSESVDEEAALGLPDFHFSELRDEVLSCPGGAAPVSNEVQPGLTHYKATFAGERCAGCPLAGRCPTRALASGDRSLRWRDAKVATAQRQREQRESGFKERYKLRSGIEATASEFKGRHGAGKVRVRGRRRLETSLRLKALAVNAKRAMKYHNRRRRLPPAESGPGQTATP